MHIDKYKIWNYNRPWKNGKQSKTEEITQHLISEDCIQSKDFIRLLEELYDTWNGDYGQKDIFVEVTFKDVER
tara:strand:- start:92 stop:310 length:219 start_codon:yes stop_codon:yes gene_type:complete